MSRTISLWIVTMFLALPAHGVTGACGDRELPSDQSRKARRIRLECTSSVDHYIRSQTPFDINAWRRLEADSREKMQEYRQNEPLIQWQGQVPYSTIEAWTWTERKYGQHPSCGYEEYNCGTETYTDSDGKSRTRTKTCTRMKTCFYEEDHNETRHCSSEVMRFSAQYIRPSRSEWNPSIKGYYDILPNKYDLLTGEIEDVQIYSNGERGGFFESSTDTTIAPEVRVGNAWNSYRSQLSLNGGGPTATCRMNQDLHLDVKIYTNHRISKKTPNTFRMPVDMFGRPTEPFRWEEGSNGVFQKPEQLRLFDAGDLLLTTLARQSRKYSNDIEKAKQEAGQSGNSSATSNKQMMVKSGFWKETEIRIKLFEITPALNRNIRYTDNLYVNGGDVAIDENYKISLDHLYQATSAVFTLGQPASLALVPGNRYRMEIAMFQKGVPFYTQGSSGLFGGEDDYFSDSLDIPFEVSKKAQDQRGSLQQFRDWRRKPLWKKIADFFGGD